MALSDWSIVAVNTIMLKIIISKKMEKNMNIKEKALEGINYVKSRWNSPAKG